MVDVKEIEPSESGLPTVNGLEEEATATTASEQGRSKFANKILALHVKTKSLGGKFAWGRRTLEQQQKNVAQSTEQCTRNDEIAAQTMKRLIDSAHSDKTPTTTTTTMTQPIAIVGSGGAVNRAITAQAAPPKSKKVRLSRQDMLGQIEGLQELLRQLTFKNPQLETYARQLAKNNPKLREFDLFTPGAGITVCQQQQTGKQQARATKSRRESEMSNSSSSNLQQDVATASTANGTAIAASGGKRKQQRQANGGKPLNKTKASEERALMKYINAIVAEYLGEQQKERAAQLAFAAGADLEAHAQRLVEAGLGRVVEVELRVNKKNNHQAFVAMSNDREGTERDGIILLPVGRRYAFEGDTVRTFVMNAGVANKEGTTGVAANAKGAPKGKESNVSGGKENSFCIADDEEDPFATEESDVEVAELDGPTAAIPDNCPKAFVIAIVKQTDLRKIVGTISFKNATKLNDDRTYYKLKPHDMRMPMLYIPTDSCASEITEEIKKDVCGFLYVAQVRETDLNGHCIGELVQPVGKLGNLEAEIKAILLNNGLKDIRPYEQRFNDLYAEPEPPIDSAQHPQREDLRSKCIFTIDPLTARDLDDAMSVECIDHDVFEVGVHISDVSHYLEEDCELDNIVKKRATSIYLVNEVIHMLPQPLCFKCSLLPGEDKFAFSVIWRLNAQGEQLEQPRFMRSIIRSCSQFAYEHAQKIIDNPAEQFNSDDDFPTICNSFGPADIVQRVRILQEIAKKLRAKRYEDGALSINNPKLRFAINPMSGEPLNYEVDGRQEANFLIEEFMLLANQTVARFVYDRFPDIAILRNHAPPLAKSMKAMREKLASVGIVFDCSSSKSVYESMQRICSEAKDPAAMDACLNTMLTKPMARAKYFCSDGKTDAACLWHYALSIPIYTHFTSPIRRYPDILVHRLLAAALDYCPPPKRTVDELHQMTNVCNDQKFNAKNAGDESINLFFKRYIKSKQCIVLRAVVTEIYKHLINVTTIETGHNIAINYKIQKVVVDTTNAPAYILISEKNSKALLKLQMFSSLEVKLVVWNDRICGFFVSPDPMQRQLNAATKKKPSASQSNDGNASAAAATCKPRFNSLNEASATTSNIQAEEEPVASVAGGAKPKTKQRQPKATGSQERVYALRNNDKNGKL